MTRPANASQSTFPNWVALASLLLALWLFFGNAVPAMREHSELHTLADELATLRRDYDAAITEARLGRGAHAQRDLQSLLVAIDQQGYTPAELCAAFPLQKDPPLLVEPPPLPEAVESGTGPGQAPPTAPAAAGDDTGKKPR